MSTNGKIQTLPATKVRIVVPELELIPRTEAERQAVTDWLKLEPEQRARFIHLGFELYRIESMREMLKMGGDY